MKKLFTFFSMAIACVMLSSTLLACQKKASWIVEPKDAYNVGIIQLVEHEALDNANQGFRDELTKLMTEAGKTVTYDNKNAQNNKDMCTTLADTMVSNKVDLMLTVATPAAQAAAGATENIPILFTAVTDAVAAGLVDSNDKPKFNVSGTSDLNPIALQVELMKELIPNLNKIAIMYTTSEKNSEVQVDLLQKKCNEENITLVKKGISDLNDVQDAFNSLGNDVQCLYLPTDNLIANSATNIHSINKDGKRIPIVCGETGMNEKCGVATYGINYYELGKQTAKMAFKILTEKADISKMPVEYLSGTPDISISQNIADEIGFTIPQSVLNRLPKEAN